MAQTILKKKKVINEPEQREKAILENTPATFEIKQSRKIQSQQSMWDQAYEAAEEIYILDSNGKSSVQKYDKKIMKYAQKHNLDPDITRAVMYAENAKGHKLGLNYLFDAFGSSESPAPMNIQKNRWSTLIGKKPEDMYDPDNNIKAATILLKRISDRVEKPTPEKIGSIWHYIGRENTNEFGEYIGEVYRKKPWKKLHD